MHSSHLPAEILRENLQTQLPGWFSADDATFLEEFPLTTPPRPGVLHRILVRSLGCAVLGVPDEDVLQTKPLVLELDLPLPCRLRFYAFLATQHESERQTDTFRIQLTIGKKGAGRRHRFSREHGIRPVLLGYEPRLEVFVLWDADVIDAGAGFPYSQGVQAPPEVLYGAAATGLDEATRTVRRARRQEVVVAARRDHLVDGLLRRIELSNRALVSDERC